MIKVVQDGLGKKLGEYIIPNFNEKNGCILKEITLLNAIIWIKDLWKNLDTDMIINCLKHAQLIDNENNFVIDDFIKEEYDLTSDEVVCSLFRKEEKVNDCLEILEFIETLNVDSKNGMR